VECGTLSQMTHTYDTFYCSMWFDFRDPMVHGCVWHMSNSDIGENILLWPQKMFFYHGRQLIMKIQLFMVIERYFLSSSEFSRWWTSNWDLVYKIRRRLPWLSATFRYGVLFGDSFESPIFFPTTISSCSSEQKTGLAQSSSASSFRLPIHNE
jgi:hypothetical protein